MITLRRTNSSDPDFIELVRQLDQDLAIRDGEDHAFYNQYNSIDDIPYSVVAYEEEKPVACGAMKPFDHQSAEIKRMFTLPEARGKGIAGKILGELEKWCSELSVSRCVLETGKKQPEAMALYQKHGYRIIENFGPYVGVENSVCFEKVV